MLLNNLYDGREKIQNDSFVLLESLRSYSAQTVKKFIIIQKAPSQSGFQGGSRLYVNYN